MAAAALAVGAALAAEEGGVPWTDDVKKALAASKQEGKPIILDTWAVWCAPCKQMDLTTYKDKDVIAQASQFVPLKVDADVHKTIIQRDQIDAFPTVLFLDADGREISRLLGFIESKQLLSAMQTIAAGYADYMKAMTSGKDPSSEAGVGQYLLAAGNPEDAADHLARALKGLPANAAAPRETVELALADADLQRGRSKPAAAAFARLSQSGSSREIKARALAGLWRAEKERGREAEAQSALDNLRRGYPDLAPALERR